MQFIAERIDTFDEENDGLQSLLWCIENKVEAIALTLLNIPGIISQFSRLDLLDIKSMRFWLHLLFHKAHEVNPILVENLIFHESGCINLFSPEWSDECKEFFFRLKAILRTFVHS